MAVKKGGESKQGLIVVLVFFILATIGLGVGAYYGFAEQETLNAKVKEEVKKNKGIAEERDWYRFQAWAVRAFLGQIGTLDQEQLGVTKASFDDGKLGNGQKDKEEFTKLFTDLSKILPWPKGKNIPESTYVRLLNDEKRRAEEIEKNNKNLATDKAALQKKLDELETTFADAKKTFETQLIASNTKAGADLSGYLKTIDDLRNQVAKLGGEKDVVVKQKEEEKLKSAKDIARLEKMIKEQVALLGAKDDQLVQARKKSGGVEMPRDWRPDWKVVSIDRGGRLVYINLGARDKVQPQLTFSLHGLDQSGKPQPESKGSVEVVNVVSEHLSQARVTGLKDPNRDPVLVNDVLYHPTWSPTLKKHVAVAGLIDLTGDGRDSMAEFLRNLERQNIIVDAYLDTRDMALKGRGMSVRTEYLILGDGPEAFADRQEKDNREFIEKLSKGMGDLQEQAVKNGVQVIGLRRYLELIGYRLPKSLVDRPAGSVSRPRTGVGAYGTNDKPAPPKEKPKDDKPAAEEKPKEDKPAEDKPKDEKPKEEKKDGDDKKDEKKDAADKDKKDEKKDAGADKKPPAKVEEKKE